ncbi:MAG: hypothetical protein ABSD39_06360 [Terriglobales bacterium]
MRNCLGVWIAGAALCVMSWAQAPAPAAPPAPTPPSSSSSSSSTSTQDATLPSAPTPQESSSNPPIPPRPVPKFARFEMFGGYTYAQMGPFNAGHWADLNGYNVSLGVNAVNWLALIVEGSEYFGNSKIPTTVQAPFPNCGNQGVSFCPPGPLFKVDTREYNVLFGAMFPYRKYERWVPFGELMYGHGGTRGEAIANGLDEVEISSGRALLAGGGADHVISERFAVRFKADYLETATSFATLGKKKQDNLRLSVGIVIRSVRKKKRRLEDETETAP